MISKRIIPQFLLSHGRLVKGTQFGGYIDVGDPVSQGMIYDSQGADEIAIVDIDATKESRLIDTKLIEKMITKCRLPISAGGGISSIEGAGRCFKAGADKIIVNTSALTDPELIGRLSDEFGSQSVVISIDVRKNTEGLYDIYSHSGKQGEAMNLEEHITRIIEYGAGELMITSIDREGTMKGFDISLFSYLREKIPISFIASGGAGSYDDLVHLFKSADCDACMLGKMLFLRDYDIVRIKSYIHGKNICIREA
jgi:imidazole glycerol-phosphate synthase subunit HisF